ncbi:MAG: hypothetical protein KDK00_03825 [Rhodobacteraceae bacterium]|nr:hypothetical protein [Paracoccaceae bacterium]
MDHGHSILSIAGLRSRLAVFVTALACSIFTIAPVGADEACIRQSLINHDYCGPEGRKTLNRVGSFLVADNIFGPFKGACAAHDYCYQKGGEKIARAMEQKYRISMYQVSDAQFAEFEFEIDYLKSRCDWEFYMRLFKVCVKVPPGQILGCEAWAAAYYAGVTAFAGSAFRSSIESGFICK